MEPLVRIAAVLGVIFAIMSLSRAGWRLIRGGVESVVAKEMARTRAHRGDVTGMREAEAEARSARRERMRAGLAVALWLAVLAVPPFTPWTLWIWAAVALLWLASRVAATDGRTAVARRHETRP